MYKVKTKELVLSTLVLASITAPVFGNEGAQLGNQLQQSERVQQTDRIVVTASKMAETIKAAPQAVEVITNEDIKHMGATDVVSALQLADNLNLSESSMTGNQVMLRGMDTKHTLILVDGKRLAGEDTDSTANVYTLGRMSLDTVDRIEIVRGATSSLYGSDAMGGVINIITKVPDTEGVTVGVNTGTRQVNNYYRYDSGKQGRWSLTTGAQFTKVRPINIHQYVAPSATAVGVDDYNRYMFGTRQNFDLSAEYDFENANKNKLHFDANYFKEHLRTELANQQGIQRGMIYDQQKDKVEHYDNTGYGLGLTYTGKTEKNDYMVRTYYSQLKKDYDMSNSADFSFLGRFSPIAQQMMERLYPGSDYDRAKYYTWVTDAQNTMYVNDDHTLTFGGEYRRVYYSGTRLGGQASADGVKNQEAHDINSYAAFIEDTWQVTDKLMLQPSLRYEHSDSFGSNVSPHIGLNYSIKDNLRFKANYGRAYKAPTVSELYMNMWHSPGPIMVNVNGNPNLEPEKSVNYDLSLEGEWGKSFAKATYYNNKISNLIDYNQWTDPMTRVIHADYVNINKAEINGVELTYGYTFSDRLTAKATYNYIDATNARTGDRLLNRPKSVTTVQLVYDDNKDTGYSASLWNTFTHDYAYSPASGRRGNGYNLYSYNTFNASLTRKFNKEFSAFVAVNNIFDKKVDDLNMYGRIWRVGAEMKF